MNDHLALKAVSREGKDDGQRLQPLVPNLTLPAGGHEISPAQASIP